MLCAAGCRRPGSDAQEQGFQRAWGAGCMQFLCHVCGQGLSQPALLYMAGVCPNPLLRLRRVCVPALCKRKQKSSFPNVWENQIMFKREAKRQQHRFQSLTYHLKICLNARSIILECLRSLFNVWPHVLEICFQSSPIYL